jgi:oxygen-dependent protoporphyrinogen oxidase
MPQYLVGHPARVAAIEAALRPFPWLALAGSAYRGVGIPDCAGNAQATVGDLLGRLSN